MRGLTIGPASVAIVWAVSIAIVLGVLTMQLAPAERHLSHLRLFSLRQAARHSARPLSGATLSPTIQRALAGSGPSGEAVRPEPGR